MLAQFMRRHCISIDLAQRTPISLGFMNRFHEHFFPKFYCKDTGIHHENIILTIINTQRGGRLDIVHREQRRDLAVFVF